jgi:hypothetical protein
VRSNKEYHHSPWHYINYPFKPQEQPESVRTTPAAPPNIVTTYAENLASRGPAAQFVTRRRCCRTGIAKAAAARQIGLAGYRLAKVLREFATH